MLGTVNPSHLKNSADLLNRIRNTNMKNKQLTSLDIVSLYTNIPVEKAIKNLECVLMTKKNLPMEPTKIIKLVKLCTSSCHFSFKGTAYTQQRGLPMGSPLSGVLACLFLESLEKGPFKPIIPRNSIYLRYIDDVLLIHPRRTKIPDLVNELNRIEPSIQFTYELEENNKLPFLDVLLHRDDTALSFSVYRKRTHKDDVVHYLSHHSKQIKSGIIIGAFLRAFRICSPNYLDCEITYIKCVFEKLKYPQYFIWNCQKKLRKFSSRRNPKKLN